MASLSVLSGELVDYVVKPNFRALGRRFGRETPVVAAAIAAMPAADVAAAVLAGGTVTGAGAEARPGPCRSVRTT